MDGIGQLHSSRALPPSPVEYNGGLVPKPERKRWRRENLFPLPGIKPRLLGHPARSLDTVYTTDHEMISASGDGGGALGAGMLDYHW
jgi:hypothetical protein